MNPNMLPPQSKEAHDAITNNFYNGSKTENYSWTQTDTELEVVVPVDAGIKSKDVKVSFKEKAVSCKIGNKVIFEGPLFKEIYVDDSTWTLDERKGVKVLSITLFKRKKTSNADHWTSVVLGTFGFKIFFLRHF